MLPEIEADTGALPPGRWRATLSEVEARFVTGAPFREERQVLFDALLLWAAQVWKRAPSARLWINGGFVTHKTWAAPSDVDVAACVHRSESAALSSPDAASLWTLHGVTAQAPESVVGETLGRVQPMAGLIDGFYFLGHLQAKFDFWDHWWQMLTGPDKQPIPGKQKGYVEVVRDG